MGQNMVGWLGVKLKGKNNQPITFRFSEILNPDTTLYVANLRSAKVTDVYTPAADGEFSWQPSFVYHGFRYVEVSGLDYQPSNRDFAGYVVYDAMSTSGQFESSNALVNQIHKNAFWGIRSNYRACRPTARSVMSVWVGWATGQREPAAKPTCLTNALLYNKWLHGY